MTERGGECEKKREATCHHVYGYIFTCGCNYQLNKSPCNHPNTCFPLGFSCKLKSLRILRKAFGFPTTLCLGIFQETLCLSGSGSCCNRNREEIQIKKLVLSPTFWIGKSILLFGNQGGNQEEIFFFKSYNNWELCLILFTS